MRLAVAILPMQSTRYSFSQFCNSPARVFGCSSSQLLHSLKGQQREMVFLTISVVSRTESKDFDFFWANFGCIQRIWRVRQDFQQLMRTSQGQYFNHGRRDILLQPQENEMQLKIFACPTGKYHSAYSPYALNKLNLSLTQ